MAEVSQDLLFTELESKQDSMLPLKHGLYASADGQDGDTCICVFNGKKLFGSKIQGEWYYTELSQSSNALVDDVAVVRQNFRQFLIDDKDFILTLIDLGLKRVPRQYNIPWYTRTFRTADDAYNKHMTGQITAGFSTQGQSPFEDFLDEIEDIYMLPGTMFCFPVPFKCQISRIRAYGNSTATAANTKINIYARGYSPSITSPSAVSTGETAGTSMSSINTGDVYWEFNNGLDVTVEANGWIRTLIETDPDIVSVASGDPYITHTSGIITLEEIF
tara:strand:- start:2405 stop:3229 length:825 start_codon:yes stop_codon:yes gene_type:complete